MDLWRALELLEFIGRDAPQRTTGREAPLGGEAAVPVDEKTAANQFAAAQFMLQSGVSKIPPELREAITWAEAEKAKRGLD